MLLYITSFFFPIVYVFYLGVRHSTYPVLLLILISLFIDDNFITYDIIESFSTVIPESTYDNLWRFFIQDLVLFYGHDLTDHPLNEVFTEDVSRGISIFDNTPTTT